MNARDQIPSCLICRRLLYGAWSLILLALALALVLFFTGCQAMNGLVFHPIQKVWSDHKSNEEAARAPKNYVQDMELKAASEEYMRTNQFAPKTK